MNVVAAAAVVTLGFLLDDISNTRRISAVVLRGTPMDRSQPVR